HDVNGMLSGEMAYGNGRGWSRVALVTLGTGLGFSMSIGGVILKNETGSPKVSIFRRPFRDGILEDYASKRGFLSVYASKGGSAETVKEIAGLAFGGDGAAKETFSEIGGIISSAIKGTLDEYGIECLLFGGQISRSFSLMEDSVRAGLEQVGSLGHIGPVSDFDNATFNGLKSLFK
ncbi:MAG: ROK family protein, partial [Candidatus Cryptobacteroides sp.]